MKNHLGRVSPANFLKRVLIEALDVCFFFLNIFLSKV